MKNIVSISTAVLAAAIITLPGGAQTRPRAAAKPATKPAVKPAQTPVKGMTQLPGDNGQLGVTYTLGEDHKVNFTLNSVEYSLTRANVGDIFVAPGAEEKLLVLRFTVHNPNKEVTNFNWNTLKFTAISADDENYEYWQAVGREGSTEPLEIDLKPAQKINGYAAIAVPAKSALPKLMVTPNGGGAVLRYDLRGKVKGLAAPFADPDDKNGLAVRTDIPGVANTHYPASALDIKFVEGAIVTGPLGEVEIEEGKRLFVATVTMRNGVTTPQGYTWNTLKPELTLEDGEKVDYSQHFLKTKRNEAAEGTLKPGEEYTGRLIFRVPVDAKVKTLTLAEQESHNYSFDVSMVK